MKIFEVQTLKRLGITTLLQSGHSVELCILTTSGDMSISALDQNEINQQTKASIHLIGSGGMGEKEQRSPSLKRKERDLVSSHTQVV